MGDRSDTVHPLKVLVIATGYVKLWKDPCPFSLSFAVSGLYYCVHPSPAQEEVLHELSCCREESRGNVSESWREEGLLCWSHESVALCYLKDLGEGE